MSDSDFTVGQQPCNNFNPQIEYNEYAQWSNRHECYKHCGKTVSFCENCCRDHHEDGYDSCKQH